MALRDGWERTAAKLIVGLALLGWAVQLVADRPVFGVVGLLLIAVPGFAIGQAVGPRPLSWPEVLLTTLGASLVVAVLAGVLVSLLPAGLDSSSVASVELAVLAAASAVWLRRKPRRWAVRARTTMRIAPGSALLVTAGVALAGAGFIVALRSEENQVQAPFVQLWSVAPAAGTEAQLGVRNATGVLLDCGVTIVRPNVPAYQFRIGAIEDGQVWLRPLLRAEDQTGTWRIELHCAGPEGTTFDRRLTINPPA
jgi:hypothetical protein